MSHFFKKKKKKNKKRKLFCLLLLLLEHFNTANTVWEQLIDRRRLFLFISEIMIAAAASNDRMLIIHDRKNSRQMCHLLVFKCGSLNNNCGAHPVHQPPKENLPFLVVFLCTSLLSSAMWTGMTAESVCCSSVQSICQDRGLGHVYEFAALYVCVFLIFNTVT